MADSIFCAVIVGIGMGALLDIFRLFRLIFNDKFVLDFLFWVISAVCVFCYLLIFNNGEIRVLYIAVIFAGGIFYILTVGRVTLAAEKALSEKIKKWLKSLKKVLQFIYSIYYNIKVRLRSLKRVRAGECHDKGNQKKQQ